MRLSIRHDTTYNYDDQVRASIQYLRLTPQESARQRVISWQLDLPRPVRAQRDPYGNILHVLTLDEPHEALVIGARGQVDIDEHCESERDTRSPLPYLRSTRLTQADDALREFARTSSAGRNDRDGLIGLMHGLHAHMPYTPGATQVDSTAAEAFAGRAGGVPGPYPCLPGLCAQPGGAVALCVRLPVHRGQRPPGQPRLGRGLAGRCLVQLRCDQPAGAAGTAS